MNTQLQTGMVRLSISSPDRRLAASVVNRILDWWDASGHRDLAASDDIELRHDVSWNLDTASVTLPVHVIPSPESEHGIAGERALPIEFRESAVESHALPRASVIGGHEPAFQVVADLAELDLMFPSEAESRRDLHASRRWRRRRGPVARLARWAAATAVSGVRRIRSVVMWPGRVAARGARASRESARRIAPRAATGFRHIVGPRPLVRAAGLSVLALAITAVIALPARIVTGARGARRAEAVRVSADALPLRRDTSGSTMATPPVRAAVPTEDAPLPSQKLAMFTTPSRISPTRSGTAYIRAARAAIRTSELASLAVQRNNARAASSPHDAPPTAAPKQLAANAPTSKPSSRATAANAAAEQTGTTGTEYTAALVITSEPSGAAVKIDGQAMGATPLQIDRIRVGSHAVHVSLDGYPVWSTAATVVYGQANSIVARLTK